MDRTDSRPHFRVAEGERCTFPGCRSARSYFYLSHIGRQLCPWHAMEPPSRRAGLSIDQRDFLAEEAWNLHKAWLSSREADAYLMLINRWEWRSSEDWCEVFGCCGRGWDDKEAEQAIGELRAAHRLAGLPVPDWFAKPSDHPPRRRAPAVAISELTARVKELEGLVGAVVY